MSTMPLHRIIVARHLRDLAQADLQRARRFLAEVDAFIATLQQDQDDEGYDGWLSPEDRYQKDAP